MIKLKIKLHYIFKNEIFQWPSTYKTQHTAEYDERIEINRTKLVGCEIN